ncbi:hypothetical protein M9458_019200, partial [Cirrhinus mrigala]
PDYFVCVQKVYHTDETGHRNHDTYRRYLHLPHAYENSHTALEPQATMWTFTLQPGDHYTTVNITKDPPIHG